MKKEKLLKLIEESKANSAWAKGVKLYAYELIDALDEEDIELTKKLVLNGAENFKEYSWGGCSLIYDCDIAERLCTPSELKKRRNGELQPNRREQWLDVQARALFHAYLLCVLLYKTEC